MLWYLLNFVNCNCNLATLPCWLNTFLLFVLLLLSYYSELCNEGFVDSDFLVDRKAPFCELKRALYVSVFVFCRFCYSSGGKRCSERIAVLQVAVCERQALRRCLFTCLLVLLLALLSSCVITVVGGVLLVVVT